MARDEAWPSDEPVDGEAGAVCDWVGWCDRVPDHEVELSNRAGSERLSVCRLHLAAARLYGYRVVADAPVPVAVTDRAPAPPAPAAPSAPPAPLGRAAGLLVFDGPEYLS